MRSFKAGSKAYLAKSLGVSRASWYYVSKKGQQDWGLKTKIELTLRDHPSYAIKQKTALSEAVKSLRISV